MLSFVLFTVWEICCPLYAHPFLGENQNKKVWKNKRERDRIITTTAIAAAGKCNGDTGKRYMLCVECDDLNDETIHYSACSFTRLLLGLFDSNVECIIIDMHSQLLYSVQCTYSKRSHYLTIFRSYLCTVCAYYFWFSPILFRIRFTQ